MIIKYIIHNYAGIAGDDKTVKVEGPIARIIMDQYSTPQKQKEIGITILDITEAVMTTIQ